MRKDLARQLDWNDYDNTVEKGKLSAEATIVSAKRRLTEKFNQLKESETIAKQHQGIDQRKVGGELSSRVLTGAEERVLRRGMNFAPASRRIPVIDIVASVECVASKMDDETVGDLRCRTCNILRRASLPPPNLQKDE